MELGGNAPLVVLPGADLDTAVEGALLAKMRNGGSACTAANRFYVHGSVHDEFVRAVRRARSRPLRVGPGLGPRERPRRPGLRAERDKVAGLVETAVAEGATLVRGGHPSADRRLLRADAAHRRRRTAATINATEIFGPVTAVVRFDRRRRGRRTPRTTPSYGLMAYVFGEEREAIAVAQRLDVGHGGRQPRRRQRPGRAVRRHKQSGLGREGGSEGILEFLEEKYIALTA